jgi:hypothetical protein
MDGHRRLRIVSGFPTPYCSDAGSIRRDQAINFPPAHGGFDIGGGITSGQRDGIGRSAERPVAPASSPGPMSRQGISRDELPDPSMIIPKGDHSPPRLVAGKA